MQRTKNDNHTPSQKELIAEYVNKESEKINNILYIDENGERNWDYLDMYNEKHSRSQEIASQIENQVLKIYYEDNIEQQAKLKRASGKALFKTGLFALATGAIFVASLEHVSTFDVIAMAFGGLAAIKNCISGIVKTLKAWKLHKHYQKIWYEWDILHTVPAYIDDFCAQNNIFVKDGPFDDVYIVDGSNGNICVTTEMQQIRKSMSRSTNRYFEGEANA